MIVRSKIKELDEWLFVENIKDKYLPNNTVITEKNIQIRKYPLEMQNFQLSAAGMFLLYSEMRCDSPIKIFTEVSGETVLSQFIFYKLPSFEKLNIFGRSRHNLRYIPSVAHEFEIKKNVEFGYFLMALSKDYYFHLINRHSSLHEDFVLAMDKKQYANFTPIDMHATPEMIRVIKALKDNPKKGELKRLHTEAKVMELLIYQLEQLGSHNDSQMKTIQSFDVLKLENVRNILNKNFINIPSQKELGQIVGLNESKLRKDFKEYYGVTIYNYAMRLKMEYAKKVLLQERKTIFETAEMTGFSHQNNFSNAFKKYFGISPSDIKYQ